MARKPAEVFPPGAYIKDELDARGWSQAEFAETLGRPARVVSEIINAKPEYPPQVPGATGTVGDYPAGVRSPDAGFSFGAPGSGGLGT